MVRISGVGKAAGKKHFYDSCSRSGAVQRFGRLPSARASRASGAKKIILDTDPGTDDAMALMLALYSPELHVRAITVVPGNVTARQGLETCEQV